MHLKATNLEADSVSNSLWQSIVNWLVKLQKDFQSKLRSNLSKLQQK